MTGTATDTDEATSADVRRRGGWTWLAGLVALTVVGALVGGFVWAGRYTPLVQGSLSVAGDAVRQPGDTPDADVYALPFRPGVDLAVTLTIRNDGRFAVTVDGVAMEDDVFFAITKVQPVAVVSSPQLGADARFPYRLGPGKELALRVSYRMQPCGIYGAQSASITGLPVRWHAFARHHTTNVSEPDVSMTVPAAVPSQYQAACP